MGTSSMLSKSEQTMKEFEKSLRVREHKTLEQIALETGKTRHQLASVASMLVMMGRALRHPGKPATYTKPSGAKSR